MGKNNHFKIYPELLFSLIKACRQIKNYLPVPNLSKVKGIPQLQLPLIFNTRERETPGEGKHPTPSSIPISPE